VLGVFKIDSHKLFAGGWLQTSILLISAFWVARITGVSYRPSAPLDSSSWLLLLYHLLSKTPPALQSLCSYSNPSYLFSSWNSYFIYHQYH
jgi:hypothetical protein